MDFRKSLQCVQWVEGGSSDQFGGGGGGTFMYEIMWPELGGGKNDGKKQNTGYI